MMYLFLALSMITSDSHKVILFPPFIIYSF
nr:MAG TPA: hypothetical protein [Caudoviricetes sp.]